jgi:hypothetical protein
VQLNPIADWGRSRQGVLPPAHTADSSSALPPPADAQVPGLHQGPRGRHRARQCAVSPISPTLCLLAMVLKAGSFCFCCFFCLKFSFEKKEQGVGVPAGLRRVRDPDADGVQRRRAPPRAVGRLQARGQARAPQGHALQGLVSSRLVSPPCRARLPGCFV